jgi:hypothetical protein
MRDMVSGVTGKPHLQPSSRKRRRIFYVEFTAEQVTTEHFQRHIVHVWQCAAMDFPNRHTWRFRGHSLA